MLPFALYSQDSKRNNIWQLGAAAAPGYPQFGIDFNSGNADTFSVLRPMAFFFTNASICDTNGQLLFYTNGNYVSNRFHQMMPGTAGFNPGDENTNTYPYGQGIYQGAIILPKPEDPDKYIILHMSADDFILANVSYTRPLSLRYSEIDISLDSGKGDFTNSKNVILIQDTLVFGRISACKHANGRDWWIITHELWSNRFYEFLLTPDTIQLFQTQNIGSTITSRMDVLGAGVFSKDGSKFAYLNCDTTLNIFNFDRCTGILTNPIYDYFADTLNLATISCAFSPSGQYLYICNNFHIFQLDMYASDIPGSKVIVAEYDNYVTTLGFRTTFSELTLAPDNKIYLSTFQGSNVFHVINSPDSAGLGCNVTQHNFILPDNNALCMPNMPNYGLKELIGSVCDSLVGIEDIMVEKHDFIIYPIPSSTKVNIKLSSDIELNYLAQLIIYNSIGSIVSHKKINNVSELSEIDIQHFSNGIYNLKLVLNNREILTGKLSVIH